MRHDPTSRTNSHPSPITRQAISPPSGETTLHQILTTMMKGTASFPTAEALNLPRSREMTRRRPLRRLADTRGRDLSLELLTLAFSAAPRRVWAGDRRNWPRIRQRGRVVLRSDSRFFRGDVSFAVRREMRGRRDEGIVESIVTRAEGEPVVSEVSDTGGVWNFWSFRGFSSSKCRWIKLDESFKRVERSVGNFVLEC